MTNMIRKRKGHRKSREGCVQCKERHAKCNEVHPRCLQCRRSDIFCSFSSPTLTTMPINEDSLADLELLEHWHRHPITGDSTETTRQIQHDLVRLGFSRPYLLNSILGLTALQLYSEDRSQSKWYARAVAHQQAAITRARPHFESLEQTQQQALLGFSAFTSMYAIAEPVYRPPGVRSLAQFDLVEELLKALHFSRSTLAFVHQNYPPLVIAESWLLTKFVVNHSKTEDLQDRYPQLVYLQECIKSRSAESSKAACMHAVQALFRRIAMASDNLGDPETSKIIWGWGLEIHQTFLDLCSVRDPMALAILAYFTVLMRFYHEHWCLRNWPGGLLEEIMKTLGKEWEDAMRWPAGIVFGSEVQVLDSPPTCKQVLTRP